MADPAEFCVDNMIDEKATEAFLMCDPEVQQLVMARGDLSDARNPSGALMGRIRDAKKASMPHVDVETFIAENDLDEKAMDALRDCAPEVQQTVMARGDLKDARNPSAALLGRIRDANAKGGMFGGAAKPHEVEKFILDNGLDERATDSLMSCSPQVQRMVIDRGGLSETRNPSSCVLGRIKDAKAGSGGGSWGSPPMMMMQMMKGMMMKGGFGKGGGMSGFGGGGKGFGGGCKGGDIRRFCEENWLDDDAATQLMNESKAVQAAVMARGSLADARNPSAAVLGRIKDAKRSSPY